MNMTEFFCIKGEMDKLEQRENGGVFEVKCDRCSA